MGDNYFLENNWRYSLCLHENVRIYVLLYRYIYNLNTKTEIFEVWRTSNNTTEDRAKLYLKQMN